VLGREFQRWSMRSLMAVAAGTCTAASLTTGLSDIPIALRVMALIFLVSSLTV
jgi:hypothetical protein